MFDNNEQQGSVSRRKNKRNKQQIKVITHKAVITTNSAVFLFLKPDDNHLLLGQLRIIRFYNT